MSDMQLTIPGIENEPRQFTAAGRAAVIKKIVINESKGGNYIIPTFIVNFLLIGLISGCLFFDHLPIKLKAPPSTAAVVFTTAINKVRTLAGIRPIQAENVAVQDSIGELPEMQDSTVIDLTLTAASLTAICTMLPVRRRKVKKVNR